MRVLLQITLMVWFCSLFKSHTVTSFSFVDNHTIYNSSEHLTNNVRSVNKLMQFFSINMYNTKCEGQEKLRQPDKDIMEVQAKGKKL